MRFRLNDWLGGVPTEGEKNMQMYAGVANNKMLDEPDDKGECGPMIEVIILTNEPQYAYGAGGLQKTYRLADSRFLATPDALRQLAKQLVEMADDAEGMADEVGKALRAAGAKAA